MSGQEIVEKAMTIAMKNGWSGDMKNMVFTDSTGALTTVTSQLIYNHDFAKALWGDEERTSPYINGIGKKSGGSFTGNAFEMISKKGWQEHLQQMVIADDPIKYLGENI